MSANENSHLEDMEPIACALEPLRIHSDVDSGQQSNAELDSSSGNSEVDAGEGGPGHAVWVLGMCRPKGYVFHGF